MSGNFSQIRIRGLSTYDSDLTQNQPDALRTCNNIVINRNNVAETRRGFKIYGNSMGTGGTVDIAKQLLSYKNRILRHYGIGSGTTLEFDNGNGVFSTFSGTYSEVSPGLRIRSVESNGNLYFTALDGVKKISTFDPSEFNSSPGYITQAGGVKALDLNGNVDYTQSGWFLQDSMVAYRQVWGIKDANKNLVLGVPSARLVLSNPISGLLIGDFNQLLHSLDAAVAANLGGLLTGTGYLQLLKLPANATAAQIYTALSNLAIELDANTYGTSTAQDIALLIKTQLDSTGDFTTPTPIGGILYPTLSKAGISDAPSSSVVDTLFTTSISGGAVSQITQITALPTTDHYIFTVSAANATAGAVYTNNSQNFTVVTTISGGTTLTCTGSGTAPLASGTLSIVSGTGDSTISFSAFTVTYSYVNTGTSDYFDIYSAGNVDQYRVYFQLGTSSAPSGAGVNLIQISLLGTETAPQVAVLIQNALASTGKFSVPLPASAVVTATNVLQGVTTNAGSFVANVGFLVTTPTSGVDQTDTINVIPGNDYTLSGPADYFDIPSAQNLITYRIWFNTGTVTAPSAINQTLLEVKVPGTAFQSIVAGYTIPSATPTSAELLSVQKLYDEMVTALINEPITVITTAAQLAGNFQNSTQSAIADLQFSIPQSVTLSNFYQIYRTDLMIASGVEQLADLNPGDEEKLVFEGNPTAQDLLNGYINYQDIVPDSFRGANLYTDPQSEEGILQANEVPPLSKDIALFRSSVFYANTATKHEINISMLGISNLVPGVSTISTISGTTVNTYRFVAEVAQVQAINTIPGGSFVVVGTADYFDAFSTNDTTTYRVWFNVGSVTPPTGGPEIQLVEVDLTGIETDIQVAQKIYDALNVYNAFVMVYPITNSLSITNQTTGISSPIVSHVTSGSFASSVTTPGAGTNPTTLEVGISTLPTPAQQVDQTARNLVTVINRNPNETIYAFYLSGPTDVPGLMEFESRSMNNIPFQVLADSTATGSEFSPNLSPANTITVISIADPTVVTSAGHGLSTGQQITIVDSNSTPSIDGIRTITYINANQFSIEVAVTIAGTSGSWALEENAVISDNNVSPNRVYFSKYQQPEAVPLTNYFDVGPKDKQIYRILPLRDSLFILKEDGVYRLTGLDALSGFTVTPFDSSSRIVAPDSAAILNNQIFMVSNLGVALVTDTGVSVVSRPIEDQILPLLLQPNFTAATFGVTYESDRSYMLWTPTLITDTVSTQCFRYNTFTQAWTTWNISKTCGLVVQELLYLGAGDTNFTEIERKNFDRTDYADREFTKQILGFNDFSEIAFLNSVSDISIGDVLYQEQYLTAYQFNQLLMKLDLDAGTDLKTYETVLTFIDGNSMFDSLQSLAAMIDSDTGIADPTYVAAISSFTGSFPDLQLAFNVIISKLNLNSNLQFKNYKVSLNTVKYEAHVTEINLTRNSVTLDIDLPLMQGTSLSFQAIPFSVEFNPQFFTDSEYFKQISETKFIFDRSNFTTATVSYATDLCPAFEEYQFEKQGNGAFGLQVFGETNFGGNADKTPFRTIVPRNKQRCRFIRPMIQHKVAREKMSLIGYSMFYTMYSERAYER